MAYYNVLPNSPNQISIISAIELDKRNMLHVTVFQYYDYL